MGEAAKWEDMPEGKSKNREKQKKSISFATGCVFCSVRAPVIRHSRKLALRLRHFARWRKLARTSLRKPRHYRLTDRLFLCFVSILQEITCESEISAASGTSKGAVSSQSVTVMTSVPPDCVSGERSYCSCSTWRDASSTQTLARMVPSSAGSAEGST